jgi:TatD DNase family protein
MFIDSHAHLEMGEFDGDRDEVLSRALAAGVERIVTVGTNLPDCRKAVEIAHRHPSVYAAIGIHPHEAGTINGETYDELKALAKDGRVVAWGEIGLDFFHRHSAPEIQLKRFEEQLCIAEELALPFVIHDRDAHRETLSLIRGWKGKRSGVIHCFSGDVAMAETCLDMGFYLSIAGPVTFPKAFQLQEVVRHCPLERLLIETDAPYLAPQPRRGKRNEPAYVVHTARQIGALKGVAPEEVGRITSENARRVFRIP